MLANQFTQSLSDRINTCSHCISYPFSLNNLLLVLCSGLVSAPSRHAAGNGYPAAVHNLDALHQWPISIDHDMQILTSDRVVIPRMEALLGSDPFTD